MMRPENENSYSDVDWFNRNQLFVRDACPSNWLNLGEELRDAAEELWRASSEGAFRRNRTRGDGTREW